MSPKKKQTMHKPVTTNFRFHRGRWSQMTVTTVPKRPLALPTASTTIMKKKSKQMNWKNKGLPHLTSDG
jgi:hypothetical protein